MLELRDITKAYTTASLTQTALDGVSVAFRDSEFVAILGQSGSGKTTMLNVIGGLDHFDSGDLLIDGVSTKDYTDRDWDAYRNNRIGFVFQSYNLIPHQSVLGNVELALTLSGVSSAERKQRATDALTEVGLADHLHKKPSQLSGGQMQRVAIARALVNDPEILLADEPTGALDSATSIQVMDLLRDVARDRLVVMVTHNPELAERYATRTVELADGQIIADSNPFDAVAAPTRAAKQARRTSMGWLTALSLSFNNLMTKKGRTIMTAFAGSIGIIGIAAILALANGVNEYIARTEEEALTSYPLQIQKVGMDMDAMMASGPPGGPGSAPDNDAEGTDGEGGRADQGDGTVATSNEFGALMGATTQNDLVSLKRFIDEDGAGISEHLTAVEYHYDVTPRIYQGDTSDGVVQVNPDQAFADTYQGPAGNPFSSMMSMDTFQQMPAESSLYEGQYEVEAGRWPRAADELVIVLGSSGQLPDILEYTLGLRDHAELEAYMNNEAAGPAAPSGTRRDDGVGGNSVTTEREDGTTGATYTYEQLMDAELVRVPAAARYEYDEAYGVWADRGEDDGHLRRAVEDGQPLEIVGIVRATDDQTMTLRRGIAYTPALTELVMEEAASSPIVEAQLADPEVDVFTGQTFEELNSGDAAREFDMSSLFTIDTQRLQAAFQIDPTQLQLNLDTGAAGLDFGAMELGDLDLGAMDLGGFDASALDLSGLDPAAVGMPPIDPNALAGAIDPDALAGAIDPSAVSLDEILAQNPQLADVDLGAIIRDSLADGAVRPGAGEYLADTAGGLLEGYFPFAQRYITDALAEQAAGDPDPGRTPVVPGTAEIIGAYLAQPQVQATIEEAMASAEVVDQERLVANLTERLGADPAIQEVAQDVREQLVTTIGRQVGAAVGAAVQDTLATTLQTTMQQTMTQMMGRLQQQIQGQLEARLQGVMGGAMQQIQTQIQAQLQGALGGAMEGLMGSMGDAMRIDPQAFQDAFQFDLDPEQLSSLLSTMLSTSATSYERNLASLDYATPEDPSQIDIFPVSFEDKDAVLTILDDYNAEATDRGEDEKVIVYTDVVGLLMSSVTQIIDVITWMLIAFVSISLVVSSIMIAIITYISVLERRKEIGILRSIGASKRSISHVFNAETFLEGLMAGVLGVVVTWLLTIPANAIVENNFGVEGIAVLPVPAALILIAVSVVLTVVAGIIPSAKAAREDPVEALRSE